MAIDKIFNDANVDGIADNIFGAVNNSVSEVKQMQQRKAAENVQMVVEAFKKIETNITEKFDNVTDVIEKRVLTIKDGRDGSSGSDGRNGRDGKPGRDGANGKQGTPGTPGKDGVDGVDGVSVTDANIDFDGSLVISLSTGQQINVGEIVPPELERQLVELRQGGGSAGSSGDVAGPTSSTDNAIVRFDGTTGKLVQNSVVTIADTTGNMAGVGTLGVGGALTYGGITLTNAVTGTGKMVLDTSPTLVTPALGSPSSVGTMPAFTLGGTVSGGGNQINNVIIGTTTPLAGAFTTLSATGQITSTFAGRQYLGTVTSNGVVYQQLGNTSGDIIYGTSSSAGGFWASGYSTNWAANFGTTLNTALIFGVNNVGLAKLDTTGLAVTGTLSATSGYNGTVGATTPGTGAFTSLTASTTLGVTGVSTLTGGAVVQGLTVGLGAGAVASNTAVGASALAGSNSGTGVNTAVGNSALLTNSTGYYNTAIGAKHPANYFSALESNTTGNSNIAVGTGALGSNTTGSSNTALGFAALPLNTTASNNTAVGYQAAYTNTTGTQNTAIGYQSFYSNTTGGQNSALGLGALSGNTTGSANSAFGMQALNSNTTASNNTAVGYQAGYTVTVNGPLVAVGYQAGYTYNAADDWGSVFVGWSAGKLTTGKDNIAVGGNALVTNSSGAFNTAIGAAALKSNTTASNNTAVGYQAGYSNTTGNYNTAVGSLALYSATTADSNAAFGYYALRATTTGADNSAFGIGALQDNTTGANNVGIGRTALGSNTSASNNTAVGYQAGYTNSTGANLVAIGYQAGYTSNASNNTFVGYYAGQGTTGILNTFVGVNGTGYLVTSGAKNTIIGAYSGNQGGLDIRTASNYIVLSDGDGNPRVISSSSEFFITTMGSGAGTNALKFSTVTGAVTYDTSSARYKDNIRNSIYGLSHVMQMRSTQFEYKDTGRSDVGLIAEELDLIIPELVGKNKDGQPDSVSYDRMISVLVKAIQEQQAIIESLKARLDAANL